MDGARLFAKVWGGGLLWLAFHDLWRVVGRTVMVRVSRGVNARRVVR